MSAGIDYGMGTVNVDRTNGIRYGVISQHSVVQAWADSAESEYGEPTCPERGAQKRLAKIMARYPGYQAYVQGDPRGAALYILRPGDVPEGADVASCYNRGIAVYK